MKKIFLIISLFSFILFPQNLTGKKICLDPGHGFIPGQASDCSDAETKRFESWINHVVVPNLKQYLQREGATVITTRADYDSIGPCITLTQRKAIANNANADQFHSVHHNAYNGVANYSLALYKWNGACPGGSAQWPGQADTMAAIASKRIFNALATSGSYVAGDMCFLGYNLGVLSTLTMPGTLSEGSFWDNPQEIPRLRCVAYLKTEAEALYHSFLEYYKKPLPAYGSLVGIITNPTTNKPANKVKIIIDTLGVSFTTDSLDNGFYRFDSLAPGSYKLRLISVSDTVLATGIVLGGTINKKNISISQNELVGDVRIKYVRADDSHLYVYWSKAAGTPEFYDIYATTNQNQWDSLPFKISPWTDSSTTINNVQPNTPYYLKIKARNAISTSPNFSKPYGAYTSSLSAKCLIIDGFNRYGGSGSYTLPNHPFAISYAEALKSSSVPFATASNLYLTENALVTSYKYIIWFLGDESTVDETFSTYEQSLITAYLGRGGNLFVTGSEIAYDLDFMGDPSDKDFIFNFLKAKYVADNPTPNTPTSRGVSGSIYQSLSIINFGQIYPEDYPDVLDTINGSYPILTYNSTQTAGILFKGIFPSGSRSSKLIYIGFPVETIADTSIRNQIITRAINFFQTTDEIQDRSSVIPKSFSISNYPNPFNPSTNVRITINKSGIYKLDIYDVLGNKIRTVFDKEFVPGVYEYSFSFHEFSSGTYFAVISTGAENKISKLLLIK